MQLRTHFQQFAVHIEHPAQPQTLIPGVYAFAARTPSPNARAE